MSIDWLFFWHVAVYRATFRMTFAEINAPTGEWRSILAAIFFALGLSGWVTIFIRKYGKILEWYYCKTLFFRCILISRFPCVENSLHFNFVDYTVNFIKQFVSRFWWCLKQMLLRKFVPYYCLHCIIPRILHTYRRRVDILCRQNYGYEQFQKFACI